MSPWKRYCFPVLLLCLFCLFCLLVIVTFWPVETCKDNLARAQTGMDSAAVVMSCKTLFALGR